MMFRIRSRREWQARRPKSITKLRVRPVREVFLHTAVSRQLPESAKAADEKEQMRGVQNFHMDARKWTDYAYSFGVFPSGRVYRGRGWRRVQAATENHNSSSLSIVTMGNTDAFAPSTLQLDSIVKTIRRGQRLGFISRPVDIRGHRDVSLQGKTCPGLKFLDKHLKQIEQRVNR